MDLMTLFLICTPLNIAVPNRVPESAWESLKRVSLQLELVGPNEKWAVDYQAEINYCRRAFIEVGNAPPLCEIDRFEDAEGMLSWLAGRKQWLTLNCKLFPYRDDYANELERIKQHILLWNALNDIRKSDESWKSKRKNLQKLRELLTPQEWFSGTLPRPWDGITR